MSDYSNQQLRPSKPVSHWATAVRKSMRPSNTKKKQFLYFFYAFQFLFHFYRLVFAKFLILNWSSQAVGIRSAGFLLTRSPVLLQSECVAAQQVHFVDRFVQLGTEIIYSTKVLDGILPSSAPVFHRPLLVWTNSSVPDQFLGEALRFTENFG